MKRAGPSARSSQYAQEPCFSDFTLSNIYGKQDALVSLYCQQNIVEAFQSMAASCRAVAITNLSLLL